MNTDFRPSDDFVDRVMARIEAGPVPAPPAVPGQFLTRPVSFLLACGAPLLILFSAAPVF